MIKLNFAHICDDARILDNGTPAVIGIFSEIIAKNKPITRPKITLILNFTPDDREPHVIDIIVKSPSGEKIKEFVDSKIGPAEGQIKNLGFILDIYNIKFAEEGVYNFEIFIDKDLKSTLPLIFSVEAN